MIISESDSSYFTMPDTRLKYIHCESKNWATFIFIVTLANGGRFFKFFQYRNQKEMAHNMNGKIFHVA